MPFTEIPNVVSNSSLTRREVLTMFQSILNDYGGVSIDTYAMRNWLNLGLYKAATLVRKVRPDVYRTTWEATVSTGGAFREVPWLTLDLSEPFLQAAPNLLNGEQQYSPQAGLATMVPSQHIYRIEEVGLDTYNVQQAPVLQRQRWRGLAERLDYPKFSAVANHLNDQWRQSVVWTERNNKLEVFFGSEVFTDPWPFGQQAEWTLNSTVHLTIIRKPIIDNLLSNESAFNNLDLAIDIPEEALPLVLEYAKTIAMASLGKPADPNMAQAEQILEQTFLMTVGNYAPAQQ